MDFEQLPTSRKVKRWENVERVLVSMTPHERRKHFDMGWWGEKTECGTVACAAGHCGLDPWFRRNGFAARYEGDMWEGFYSSARNGDRIGVQEYFGWHGYNFIFTGGLTKYSAVLKAVRAHIKQLKAA